MPKFLLVQHNMVGDNILSLPLLRLIRLNYPDATIAFINQTENQNINALLASQHLIDHTLTTFNHLPHFDYYLHTKDIAPFAWQAFTHRIKNRVGPGSQWPQSLLFNHKVKPQKFWHHQIERNTAYLEALQLKVDPFPYYYFETPPASKKEYIGLVVGRVGFEARYWNFEEFTKLIELIDKKLKMKVALFEPDQKIINRLLSNHPHNVVDLSKNITITKLPEILSKCHAVVSVNTGPAHLCAAMKIPIVMLLINKAHSPARWAPIGTEHIVLHNQNSCLKRCLPPQCKQYVCWQSLNAQTVFEALEKILNHKGITNRDEAFYNCFQLSANILTFDLQIASYLTDCGFNCHYLKASTPLSDLVQFIVNHDINLIQGPLPKPLKITLAKIIGQNLAGETILYSKTLPANLASHEIINYWTTNL